MLEIYLIVLTDETSSYNKEQVIGNITNKESVAMSVTVNLVFEPGTLELVVHHFKIL